ncbi:MAG: hypothetical protein HZC24_13645 [Rhodocyclales bacterium]|nr:hypothetical protein [Rhodocyclales bacterium]
MSGERDILRANIAACGQRVGKLVYSLAKSRPLFPMTQERIGNLTDDQEESIDALILRYSQCVSMIQDQIFRGIAYVEHEDIGDKSNRDRTLLMEKLGAIKSADAFGTAAALRNKFSHHYPEEAEVRIARLNLVVEEATYVVATFDELTRFLQRKGFAGTEAP